MKRRFSQRRKQHRTTTGIKISIHVLADYRENEAHLQADLLPKYSSYITLDLKNYKDKSNTDNTSSSIHVEISCFTGFMVVKVANQPLLLSEEQRY